MFDKAFPLPGIDWVVIAPVAVVFLTGIAALIAEMLTPRDSNGSTQMVSLFGLAAAGILIAGQMGLPPVDTLAGMALRDRFGLSAQLLLVVSCALTLMFSEGYLREKKIAYGEFYAMLLFSAGGGMLMAGSTNLLVLFLGLEVLSISLYVLAGLSRSEGKSEESALKYFLLGAFASGFLLYGISFLYGASGSLDLRDMALAWNTGNQAARTLLVFGTGLITVALGFKAAFVPFHQWTPDVYQGAPTNVTTFMAAGSKIAAIVLTVRVLEATGVMSEYWMPALYVIAILTMTVGNLVALMQQDVKRILAYSSIAHAGYLLVGILAHVAKPHAIGTGTILYYLASYSLMTIGAFAVVSMVAKEGKESTTLESLHGLWQRAPFAAGALIVFVASLIGIPPTAGFFGKFFIFTDALSAGLTPLAIILAVNSIVSIAYYLAIAKAAFVSTEGAEQNVSARMNTGLAATFAVCVAGLLAAAVFITPFTNWLTGPR